MRGLRTAALDLALDRLTIGILMVMEAVLFFQRGGRQGHFVDHLPGIIPVSAETASCWKIWSEAWS